MGKAMLQIFLRRSFDGNRAKSLIVYVFK